MLFFYLIFSIIAFSNNKQRIDFWKQSKRGANIFNSKILQEDIRAAKKLGISFIRLAPDKFLSHDRDFLIGNCDQYKSLNAKDLVVLKKVLSIFEKEKMPVVLTMLSLPGSRWRKNNNHTDDLRLWHILSFQKQAAQFWKDLVGALKEYKSIVGIDILNEPHPEKNAKINPKLITKTLSSFYAKVVKEIRAIDRTIPIIIESSAHGDPRAFDFLQKHDDPYILYSFHMYEPYEYTNLKINKGQFTYPGLINGKIWDKNTLKHYMNPVINFQKRYNLPSHRILVGEFGGNRRTQGLLEYFKDLTSIFQEHKWHFAFYAFREDTWEGMDYELGTQALPESYWQRKSERKMHYPKHNPFLKTLL